MATLPQETVVYRILFLSHDPQASVIPTSQPHVFSAPFDHVLQDQNNTTTPPRATLLFTLPSNLNFSETRAQCLNGVLCFHPRINTKFSPPLSPFTVIANPTTKQILTLPLDHSIANKEFHLSTHFGYDPVRYQFKVLRFIKYRDYSHEFKVLSLGGGDDGENSWRVVTPDRSIINCLLYSLKQKRGLCVNGTIYWTHSTTTMNPSFSIVTFDVGTEQFSVMPFPSGYSYGENVRPSSLPELVEIDGCLSLIGCSGNVLKFWILKDYQAQVWEQTSIVLPDGIKAEEQVVFPLCRVHTGGILLLPRFLPRRVRGIYYDMEKMSCRSVVVMEMLQPLWPDDRTGELDIFFCEERFRLVN